MSPLKNTSYLDPQTIRPAASQPMFCLLVEVDAIDLSKLTQDENELLLVDVYELLDKLSASPYYGITTDLGISQLISEDMNLHG